MFPSCFLCVCVWCVCVVCVCVCVCVCLCLCVYLCVCTDTDADTETNVRDELRDELKDSSQIRPRKTYCSSADAASACAAPKKKSQCPLLDVNSVYGVLLFLLYYLGLLCGVTFENLFVPAPNHPPHSHTRNPRHHYYSQHLGGVQKNKCV